jgi:hypothetical protein
MQVKEILTLKFSRFRDYWKAKRVPELRAKFRFYGSLLRAHIQQC